MLAIRLLNRTALGAAALALMLASAGSAAAQTARPYPDRAPIDQYRVASQAEEIALARSAAPPAISDKAQVLVLGAQGYETAVDGTNGFVCIVERSWGAGFEDAVFWQGRLGRQPARFSGDGRRQRYRSGRGLFRHRRQLVGRDAWADDGDVSAT